MKYLIFTLTFLFLFTTVAKTQLSKKLNLTGFVKTDIFYDSRQTVDARDGHFLLYPKNIEPYGNNPDINNKSKFNILSIQSRLRLSAIAPDILNAKTTAIIEGAFFGNIGPDINGFRLRHAFVKLDWKNSQLLIGQYWHPLFVTACYPATISFNTGTPFQAFSRNPQIRFVKKFGKLFFSIAALSQIDFKDTGPDITADLSVKKSSAKFLQSSGFPEVNLNLVYKNNNLTKNQEIIFGFFVNYKTLSVERKITVYDIALNPTPEFIRRKIYGISFMGFTKIKTPTITAKMEYIYGQLLESMTMLGGYAISVPINAVNIKMIEEKSTYIPINTNSIWFDFHTNGKVWQYGIFGGYTENKGLSENNSGIKNNAKLFYFSRGSNIDYIYRFSPRISYNAGNLRISSELELTAAAYGITNNNGKVENGKEIKNYRGLLGVYYFF